MVIRIQCILYFLHRQSTQAVTVIMLPPMITVTLLHCLAICMSRWMGNSVNCSIVMPPNMWPSTDEPAVAGMVGHPIFAAMTKALCTCIQDGARYSDVD